MYKYILGIESSCDETSAAVVEDGKKLLSNIVASQISTHSKYGGVGPEVASRMHLESILPVIEEALAKADLNFEDIDGIAVTQGPGLIGSLLVGLASAKSLAFALDKPLLGVNHLEAHISAVHLENNVDFPFIALIASGGHTNLYIVRGYTEFELISKTRDDAAGEAFDKAAKALGLGYPGGVMIDKLSKSGDRKKYKFPIPFNTKKSYDFSFSGIKTSLVYFLKKHEVKNENDLNDICASYQESIVRGLLNKTFNAANEFHIERVVLCGGVACNSRIRELGAEFGEKNNIKLFYPSPSLCTDNAAMIATLGYYRFQDGDLSKLNIGAYSTLKAKIVRGQKSFGKTGQHS